MADGVAFECHVIVQNYFIYKFLSYKWLFTVKMVCRFFYLHHHWPSDSALKVGRRDVPGSIPGRAWRPSRSEFSVFFLRNLLKYELGYLRKTPTEGVPPTGLGPISGQLELNVQPTNQPLVSI